MFGLNQTRRPPLTRAQALAGVPVRHEGVGLTVENGRTLVVARAPDCPRAGRPLLARLLPPAAEPRFALDELGAEVFNDIDGRRTVRELVDRFTARHTVNRREAELSVAAFIRLLVRRNLVSIAIPPQ